MESIKIENLSFTYPLEKKCAIDDISLVIKQGEFVTLCGRSGCGKTTLLRQIKQVLANQGARKGTILFEGKEVGGLSQREQAEKIGFVFQDPDGQIVTDTVWHELAFGLESLSYSKTEIRARVAEMASFFGMADWFHKKIEDLSGGQKQLLNLASVMVMQPRLLLLDEPTSQLDPIAAQNFLDLVYKINRELGTTVILSEHRLEVALPLSDRLVVLEKGKIIANDTPVKAGESLYRTKNDMFYALPTPMRVYYSKKTNTTCPVTIRDGRKWLTHMPREKTVLSEDKLAQSDAEALSLSDIWFRYQKELPDVLRGLSLSVKQGEIYAIVGGNGSGKTTLLSVIAGLERHYRGKIKIEKGKKIGVLPQNPQSLFLKNTVRLDLYDMLSQSELTREEKEATVLSVAEFCGLTEFIDRHPYDLAGGEQQRVALSKVLLAKPDILLLDEPTKGLDVYYKTAFARILGRLRQSGATVVMVSHDIEFCAKNADRCGMFFDGSITSEGAPRSFFSGNCFYTTAANRMGKDIIDNVVLDTDIIRAIGGELHMGKQE